MATTTEQRKKDGEAQHQINKYIGLRRGIDKALSLANNGKWYDLLRLTYRVEDYATQIILDEEDLGRMFDTLRLRIFRNYSTDVKKRACREKLIEIIKLLSNYGLYPVMDSHRETAGVMKNMEAIDNMITNMMPKYSKMGNVGAYTDDIVNDVYMTKQFINSLISATNSIKTQNPQIKATIPGVIQKATQLKSSMDYMLSKKEDVKIVFETRSELYQLVTALDNMIKEPERADVEQYFLEEEGIKLPEIHATGATEVVGQKEFQPGSFDWIDEEWKKALTHPSIFTIVGARNEGKCLTYDTEVAMADRTVKKIGELNRYSHVLGLNGGYETVETAASPVSYSGRQPVYEVLLETGKRIEGTINHPVLTTIGWRNIGDLNKHSLVATADNNELDWDKVASIEYRGVKDTYDIQTGTLSFIANNIVVHNSQLGYTIMEYYMNEYEVDAYLFSPIGMEIAERARQLLPKGTKVVDDINDVGNNSIVLFDEAHIAFHSRTSMKDTAMVYLDKVIELTRQKNQTHIYVTQRTSKLDRNIFSGADALLVKKPGKIQVRMERGELKDVMAMAEKEFDRVERQLGDTLEERKKKRKGYVYVYAEDFVKMKHHGMCSFWNEDLSELFGK